MNTENTENTETKRSEADALAFGDFAVNLYKLLLPGYVNAAAGDGRRRPIHIRISIGPDTLNKSVSFNWREPHFSGMGVIGAKANGDAWRSSYQCEDSIRKLVEQNVIEYCEGWDKAALIRLLEVWEKWHLNGMRAGCEHQRESWNPREKIEVVEWSLSAEAYQKKKALEAKAVELARGNEIPQSSEGERQLLSMPLSVTWPTAPPPIRGMNGEGSWQVYQARKRELKDAGWVWPKDHPKGLLCRKCEVCGYEYGSAWLFEPIPREIIDYVRSLPDAAEGCAWREL